MKQIVWVGVFVGSFGCPSPSPTPVYPPTDADADVDACEIFARANTELRIALPDGGQRILLCDGGSP